MGRLMRAEGRAPFTTLATSAFLTAVPKYPGRKKPNLTDQALPIMLRRPLEATGHTASMRKKQKVMGIGAQFASSFIVSAGPAACEMVLPTVTVGISASVYLT